MLHERFSIYIQTSTWFPLPYKSKGRESVCEQLCEEHCIYIVDVHKTQQ